LLGEYRRETMADFLEKIAESIDKSVKAVTSMGRELIGTTKLRSEIKRTQESIQNSFQTLGRKVYETVNRGALNEDELRRDCAEIAKLFGRVAELEEAMRQAELEAVRVRYGPDAVLCPKCGGVNKAGDRFCGSCGTSLALRERGDMACSSCGAQVQAGAKFCVKCGARIGLDN
jgi:hypothetical protein